MSELAFMRTIFEKNNNTLAVSLIGAVVINLILLFCFLAAVNKPARVIYVDEHNMPFMFKTQEFKVTEDMLKSFVRLVLNNYLCFGPETLPKQIEDIKIFLEEAPQQAMTRTYQKNKDKLIQSNVFQQFAIEQIEIIKKSAPFVVKVSGTKTVLVKGNSKYFKNIYFITINKILPTQNNSFGLIVAAIRQEKEGPSQ